MQEDADGKVSSAVHMLHQSRPLNGDNLRVRVIGAWRYPVDDTFYKSVAEQKNRDDTYAFDVEVCDLDESCKTKCVVLPKFNEFVQRGGLEAGILIDITLWKVCYDEAVVGGDTIPILVEIASVSSGKEGEEKTAGDLSAVPWWTGVKERETAFRPLAGKREYYLDLWNREDPLGERWDTMTRQSFIVSCGTEASLYFRGRVPVASLRIGDKRAGPVCGCVVEKHRLLHYGEGKSNKFPFQFTIVLKDETGSVTVTLWDTLCASSFRSIRLGDIICCSNYRVKRNYTVALSNQALRPFQGEVNNVNSVELSLNPVEDPTDMIQIIPPEMLSSQLRRQLPSVPFDFVDCQRLAEQADSSRSTCDFVGLVVYAGPWERTPYSRQRPDTNLPELAQSRLVALRDGTWPWPITLRIYALSDPDAFHYIHPGCLLACTHCFLCHLEPPREITHCSDQDEEAFFHLLLTTTRRSQIFVSKFQSKLSHMEKFSQRPFLLGQPAVRSAARWADGLSEQELAGLIVEAGGDELDNRLHFPPLPSTVEGVKQHMKQNKYEPTASVELASVLDSLQYRESRVIFLQATVAEVAVSFHTSQPENLLLASNSAAGSQVTNQGSTFTSEDLQQPVAGSRHVTQENNQNGRSNRKGQGKNPLGQPLRSKRPLTRAFATQLSSEDEDIELQGLLPRKRKRQVKRNVETSQDSGLPEHSMADSEYTSDTGSHLDRLPVFDYIQALKLEPTSSQQSGRRLLTVKESREEEGDSEASSEFQPPGHHQNDQVDSSMSSATADSADGEFSGSLMPSLTGLQDVVQSVQAHARMQREVGKTTLLRCIRDCHTADTLQVKSTLSFPVNQQSPPDISWTVTFLLNNSVSFRLPLPPCSMWSSKICPIAGAPTEIMSALCGGCAPQRSSSDQDTSPITWAETILNAAELQLSPLRFLVVLDTIRESVHNVRVSLLRALPIV